ncbi:TPA: hypothetical protein ACH3X1_014062 [Trebouxia sp. C0004]
MESFTSEQATDSDDINSMLAAGVWKVHLKLQFDAQMADNAAASAAAASDAVAASGAATTSMHMDDDETAAAPTNAAQDAGKIAQAKAVTRIIDVSSMTAAEKQQEISTISSAGDHGQPAQSWLYGVDLYFQAEYTPNPDAKTVTYLHGEARHWWQQMSAASTCEMFSQAFLARFVKPSDSAKARAEIPHLKQTGSVESFASHFRNVKSRISVGSPVDTTTLAGYFVPGLKTKLATALAAHCSLATMQELDSVISAAEGCRLHWQY